MATATKDVSLNKKVSQFFWRSWAIQASWNYERQMNMGFLYGMGPTLDRLYPDESDPKQLAAKKEAYHRHMAFNNCTPQTSAFILGLTASMEEEYAKDPENFNPDSINAVKTSLMGPLSGILMMLPGMSAIGDIDIPDVAMKKPEAIIRSMTPKERRNPGVLNASRRKRIAKGSGTSVQEVNRLMNQFNQSKQLMKQLSGKKLGRRGGFPFKF